jgi:OOP family OmpA-OmpF porin
MMKRRKLYTVTLGAMLLAGASASGVSAQEVEQGFYIAPSLGYYLWDSDKDNQTEDAPFYGLSLGYQLNKNLAIEASYFMQDSEVKIKDDYVVSGKDASGKVTYTPRPYSEIKDASGKIIYAPSITGNFAKASDGKFYKKGESNTVNMYRIDGIFSLPLSGGVTPFVAVGYTRLDPDISFGKKDDMMDVALGVKKSITPALSLRGDVRALHSWDNEDTDYSVGLGVAYLFGRAPAAATPIPTPAQPGDADGDGVPDGSDLCPDTPAGVAVDKDGCPLDSDHDGVPDYLDKCPDTPPNTKVDKDGCPALGVNEEVGIELEVLFDTNKAVVKPQYLDNVKKVADFMRLYANTTADIEGHTDSKGSATLNKKLSQRRADAVREALVSKFGIDASRLRAIGYGKDRPIADNKTEAGRQKNRRVVAVVRAMVQKPPQ